MARGKAFIQTNYESDLIAYDLIKDSLNPTYDSNTKFEKLSDLYSLWAKIYNVFNQDKNLLIDYITTTNNISYCFFSEYPDDCANNSILTQEQDVLEEKVLTYARENNILTREDLNNGEAASYIQLGLHELTNKDIRLDIKVFNASVSKCIAKVKDVATSENKEVELNLGSTITSDTNFSITADDLGLTAGNSYQIEVTPIVEEGVTPISATINYTAKEATSEPVVEKGSTIAMTLQEGGKAKITINFKGTELLGYDITVEGNEPIARRFDSPIQVEVGKDTTTVSTVLTYADLGITTLGSYNITAVAVTSGSSDDNKSCSLALNYYPAPSELKSYIESHYPKYMTDSGALVTAINLTNEMGKYYKDNNIFIVKDLITFYSQMISTYIESLKLGVLQSTQLPTTDTFSVVTSALNGILSNSNYTLDSSATASVDSFKDFLNSYQSALSGVEGKTTEQLQISLDFLNSIKGSVANGLLDENIKSYSNALFSNQLSILDTIVKKYSDTLLSYTATSDDLNKVAKELNEVVASVMKNALTDENKELVNQHLYGALEKSIQEFLAQESITSAGDKCNLLGIVTFNQKISPYILSRKDAGNDYTNLVNYHVAAIQTYLDKLITNLEISPIYTEDVTLFSTYINTWLEPYSIHSEVKDLIEGKVQTLVNSASADADAVLTIKTTKPNKKKNNKNNNTSVNTVNESSDFNLTVSGGSVDSSADTSSNIVTTITLDNPNTQGVATLQHSVSIKMEGTNAQDVALNIADGKDFDYPIPTIDGKKVTNILINNQPVQVTDKIHLTKVSDIVDIFIVYDDEVPNENVVKFNAVALGKGTLNYTKAVKVNKGEDITLTATPQQGYQVAGIYVNNQFKATNQTTFLFKAVSKDFNVEVLFTPIESKVEPKPVSMKFKANSNTFLVNDKSVVMNSPATASDNKVYIPMEAFLRALNVPAENIDWNPITGTFTFTTEKEVFKFTVGSNVAYKNGSTCELGASLTLTNGKIMVPVTTLVKVLTSSTFKTTITEAEDITITLNDFGFNNPIMKYNIFF